MFFFQTSVIKENINIPIHRRYEYNKSLKIKETCTCFIEIKMRSKSGESEMKSGQSRDGRWIVLNLNDKPNRFRPTTKKHLSMIQPLS